MRLLLATLLALAAFPAAALAAPVVTTGAADPVGQTTATVQGTIDPEGEEATYFFEYGTTESYGLTTVAKSAGSGTEPVQVAEALSGLSPNTTYHFRLASGDVRGADATFRTAAAPLNPALPSVAARNARDRTPTSARLTFRLDPNRAATTYFVEWGYSTGLGQRTPDQQLPAGDAGVPVSVDLAGLLPNRRVHWRVVAANAAGVRRTGTTSFYTQRAPTAISAVASVAQARWGDPVSVLGHVDGAGVNGMTVTLEETSFPFGDFRPVATARVDSRGNYRFAAREALISVRWRVVARSTPILISGFVGTDVRPRLRAWAEGRTRRTARVAGAINPGLGNGAEVALQRRARRGARWFTIKRKAPRVSDASRAEFAFKVDRERRASRLYRVRVTAGDGGFLPATSGRVRVGRVRR